MSVVFVAAYNFQVLVPLLTFRMLGGSERMYGVVMFVPGSGRRNRLLAIASWLKPGNDDDRVWCGLLSIVHIWLALPFGVYFALAGMFLLGVFLRIFNVTVASTLQLRARDDVRDA